MKEGRPYVGMRLSTYHRLRDLEKCLQKVVMGMECQCAEEGMTVSGVGVCMTGDDCPFSMADRLLVEDFHTAQKVS